MGGDLPQRVDVRWELADDERFAARRRARRGDGRGRLGAQRPRRARAGSTPARWYWYRFTRARPAAARSAGRGPRRRADAAATLRFAIASCQRYDVGHYAAWRHVADEDARPGALPRRLHLRVPDAARAPCARTKAAPARHARRSTAPATRRTRAIRTCRPRTRAAPWLLVWDDHEVANDYAGLQGAGPALDFARAARRSLPGLLGAHAVRRSRRGRVGADMRIVGRLDWGTLARIHLLDDRQYRDPQACPKPGRGGSNTVALAECAALVDPARTLLGAEQERWLADGWDLARPWNLLAQQTLMARFAWRDPATAAASTGPTAGTATRRRATACSAPSPAKKVPGVVVLGGDVHSHYVADLKADYDDAALAGRRERVLRHVDHQPVARRSRASTRRASSTRTSATRAPTSAATWASSSMRSSCAPPAGRRPARRSGERVATAARFVVDAARPGATAA